MKAAQIRPITELKNRTKQLVKEVSEGGASIVVTQNGKPKVVVMDVVRHDQLQDTLAMLKLLAQSQANLARTRRTFSTDVVRRRTKAALAKALHRA